MQVQERSAEVFHCRQEAVYSGCCWLEDKTVWSCSHAVNLLALHGTLRMNSTFVRNYPYSSSTYTVWINTHNVKVCVVLPHKIPALVCFPDTLLSLSVLILWAPIPREFQFSAEKLCSSPLITVGQCFLSPYNYNSQNNYISFRQHDYLLSIQPSVT